MISNLTKQTTPLNKSDFMSNMGNDTLISQNTVDDLNS